ncbi:APC family permease [Conexibacter woesei]|uniref:Amino acid permease-associated region n=1 Tax=Conexibacter woesei (strain DSM 14684 / CCUG 47730 / CIP 108061 / JCM 11494 / NBRC 100937 / ID131577) TaxID=469383 RepID=D3F8N6_CONWI|nr:APC family permease [Conexibacter woesei]ADB51000.1 amino acid permease-associated region [Conexibacter woesei DSM 14684]
MSTHTSDGQVQREAAGLERGTLAAREIAVLSVAYFGPAAALSSLPAFVLFVAGPGAWLSFLVAFAAMLCVAYAVVGFARRYVVSGSLYSYVGQVLGAFGAFVTGYGMLIGYGLLGVVVLTGVGTFLGSFLLSIGVGSGIDVWVQAPIYVVVVVAAGWFTSRGAEASAKVTLLLQVVTLPALLLVVVATVLDTGLQLGSQLSLEGSTFSGLTSGVAIAVTGMIGFEASTALAAESREPRKATPRIVYAIVIVLGLLYVLMAFAQVPALLGAGEALGAGVSPIAALADAAGLGFLTEALDLLLAGSLFAALVSIFNSLTRVIATMAQDGMLPRRLGVVDAVRHTPTTAIVVLAVLAFLTPTITLAVTDKVPLELYVLFALPAAFGALLAYAMVCVASVVLRAREGRAVALALLTGVVGVAVSAWVFADSIIHPGAPPADAMPYLFAGAVVLGIAAHLLSRSRRGLR